jgi:serine protease
VFTPHRILALLVVLVVAVGCRATPPATPAELALTTDRITLSPDTPSRDVTVRFSGPAGTSIAVTASVSDSRLTVDPTSFTVPAGGEATVTIGIVDDVDVSLTGTVTFSAAGVADVVVEVVVTLTGLAGCFIEPGEPLPLVAPLGAPTTSGHVPGQLLVAYHDGVVDAAVRLARSADVARSAGVTLLRAGRGGTHDLVLVDGDLDVARARLASDPRVRAVSRNYVAHRLVRPDAHYDAQWYLWDFGVEEVWSVEDGAGPGAPVVVAVVDDGVHVGHVDLQAKALPGRDVVCGDADVRSLSDHGTHVASVAVAASSPNGLVVGVAPGARVQLLPVKVFPDDPAMGGTLDAVLRGIRWAAGLDAGDGSPTNPHAADVINLSLGFDGVSDDDGAVLLMQEAVDAARDRGALLVAAAGNEGRSDGVLYPARLEGVLAVGSIDWEFTRSDFSTHGAGLDLMAPGGSAPGDVADDETCLVAQRHLMVGASGPDATDLSCQSGTSMAAAFVAGVAALLIADDDAAFRRDPDAISARLIATAVEPDEYSLTEFGSGVVCPDAVFGLGTACGLPPGSFGP